MNEKEWERTLVKWGNGLAIRIPAELLRELNIGEGDRVMLSVDNGQIICNPAPTISVLSDRKKIEIAVGLLEEVLGKQQ